MDSGRIVIQLSDSNMQKGDLNSDWIPPNLLDQICPKNNSGQVPSTVYLEYKALGTECVLPSTWYQVLGTKDLVLSTWCQVHGTGTKYLVTSTEHDVEGQSMTGSDRA